MYSKNGSGVYHISGMDYPISPGMILIFPASLVHYAVETQSYARWNLCVLPTYFDENETSLQRMILYDRINATAERKISSIFKEIEWEMSARQSNSERYLNLLISKLMIWVQRGQTNKGVQWLMPPNASPDPAFPELINYIEHNLDKDLSLERLASEFNYSPSQIWRIIRTSTQQSPIEYINNRRLDHARRLLMYSDQSIATIATMTGFRSASYFSRVFKDKTGITPRDYRMSEVSRRSSVD